MRRDCQIRTKASRATQWERKPRADGWGQPPPAARAKLSAPGSASRSGEHCRSGISPASSSLRGATKGSRLASSFTPCSALRRTMCAGVISREVVQARPPVTSSCSATAGSAGGALSTRCRSAHPARAGASGSCVASRAVAGVAALRLDAAEANMKPRAALHQSAPSAMARRDVEGADHLAGAADAHALAQVQPTSVLCTSSSPPAAARRRGR